LVVESFGKKLESLAEE